MQQVMITEFSGSHKDMTQPSEFLKIVGRSLMGPGQVATDDQKIGAVGCWLKTGSPAKTWFNKTSTPKTKYAKFAQAFKTEFKDVEKAEKSAPELEREIAEMRIKTEDLGRAEKYRGQDVYTHIIFAEKILDPAKRAKIDKTTSGLFNVRDKQAGRHLQMPSRKSTWVTSEKEYASTRTKPQKPPSSRQTSSSSNNTRQRQPTYLTHQQKPSTTR